MGETKTYYDSQERPRSLSAMVKVEPDWAANRIRAGEEAETKLAKIRDVVERCRERHSAALSRFAPGSVIMHPGDNQLYNDLCGILEMPF